MIEGQQFCMSKSLSHRQFYNGQQFCMSIYEMMLGMSVRKPHSSHEWVMSFHIIYAAYNIGLFCITTQGIMCNYLVCS